MENRQICPTCKSPIRSEMDASLTQWMLSCACTTSQPQPAKPQSTTIGFCPDCGKPTGETVAEGGFTQFLLQSDFCTCKISGKPADGGKTSASGSPTLFPTDRYEPLKKLGGGGMGDVYLANDRLLGKSVAVKILHRLDAKDQVAFQDEAKALSKLKHETIVEVLDFGVLNSNTPYMVLEYVEGRSLRQLIDEGTLDIETINQIFDSTCTAIDLAQSHGILHGDVQPNNILIVEKNGRVNVKLIDFGLSTLEGLAGSPLYMSPDSGLGRAYDIRSETYSLGCVLFEMLAGKPPLQGENPLHTLYLHANQIPPLLSACTNRFQDRLQIDDVLNKALAKDPGERFSSAAAFSQAFQAALSGIPATADSNVQGKGRAFSTRWILGLAILICAATALPFLPHKGETETKPVSSDKSNVKEGAKAKKEAAATSKTRSKEPPDEQVSWQKDGIRVEGDVDDNDLAQMAKFTDIEEVKFASIGDTARKLTGTGFSKLVGNPIRDIEIISEDFTDNGAEALAQLKTIKKLRIEGGHLTEKGMKSWEKLPQLQSLLLNSMTITPKMLEELGKFDHLSSLNLSRTALPDRQSLKLLFGLTKLELLNISNTDFDDAAIQAIGQSKIQRLEVEGTAITDKGLEAIAKNFKRLNHIRFGSSRITKKGLAKFKQLRPGVQLRDADQENVFRSIMTD